MVSPNWKYLTVGVLAILAVGFSIPQASAHITNGTQHMLQHIYNFVDGIEAKTENLPTDPADQSEVESAISRAEGNINTHTDDAMFTQVITKRINSFDSDQDVVECTSDQAYVISVNLFANGAGGSVLLSFNPAVDGVASTFRPISQDTFFSMPREADGETTVTAFDNDQEFDYLSGFVSIQTAAGATASCERS